MEVFQGAMMGLSATGFWRKDFGANGVAMDAILAAVPLTMAIAPDSATGSGFIIVLVLALATASCFHPILPRATSGATKNWRMFLVTSILWACSRYTVLTQFWHFGAITLGAGALQLLRRPERLKAALRDWRVATGPVYTIAAGMAFYHHSHESASGDVSVELVGIWSVATAAIMLRPDNSKLDMALVMMLPVRARIWPTSPRKRAMCHGLLMLLSMVSLAILLVREGSWRLLCICGALLAMEALRRLHARGTRSAGSSPSQEHPPVRPPMTTVPASLVLPDGVLHMICRAAIGEGLSALEMVSRSCRSSVKTCAYVDTDGTKAYRLDGVGDGAEPSYFKVWDGRPFYFEDWDGWRFFYEEWDGERAYYDYFGGRRFYYDYMGGEKFHYDYADGQKHYCVIGKDGRCYYEEHREGALVLFEYRESRQKSLKSKSGRARGRCEPEAPRNHTGRTRKHRKRPQEGPRRPRVFDKVRAFTEASDGERHDDNRQELLTRAEFERLATRIIEVVAGHSSRTARPCAIHPLAALVSRSIRGILADPTWFEDLRRHSYSLPNGFRAVRVLPVDGFVLRLHEFNQKDLVDGLHSHKWCFESFVLAGELRSENWEVYGPALQIADGETTVTGKFLREKEGSGSSRAQVTRLEEEVHLRKVEDVVTPAGEAYYMDDRTIHRVMKSSVFTSTLILTHPVTAHAVLYDRLEDHAEEEEQVLAPLSVDVFQGFLVELARRLQAHT